MAATRTKRVNPIGYHRGFTSMRTPALVRAWNWLPAVLAFVLLCIQVWIPWTVPHYVTHDGSSYVYSAIVARDLVFHPDSQYASIYKFRRNAVPNWGTLIVLNIILSFAGIDAAEKLLASIYLCIGFFSFAYAIRSISPESSPWTPLTNFALQNWFLWTGFYNFYLGMALCPFVIGFYIRHASAMTVRRAIIVSAGLVTLFFTHLMAGAIAVLVLGATAVWIFIIGPYLLPAGSRPNPEQFRVGVRQAGLAVAMVMPVVVLMIVFAVSQREPMKFTLTVVDAWSKFPLNIFTTSDGFFGKELFLWPVVLAYIVAALFAMQASEWRTARGGLALAIIVAYAIYLILPDEGLGGAQSKIRFAWAMFVFGGILASSVHRLRPWRTPLALYVSGFLLANLISTTHTLRAYSAAVEDYLSAADGVRHGARLVRVHYATPDIPERYGFRGFMSDPLLKFDSYIAARCHCVDLSDYQAPSHIFPVAFNSTVDRDRQDQLSLGFEYPGTATSEILRWLDASPLGPLDYVFLVADHLSPQGAGVGFPRVLAALRDAGMQVSAKSSSASFVRVYEHRDERKDDR
jgi:hypothetical protein